MTVAARRESALRTEGVHDRRNTHEEQVGELLDDRERIRNTARPHRVPDLVDLGLEFTRDHDFVSPRLH